MISWALNDSDILIHDHAPFSQSDSVCGLPCHKCDKLQI